MRTLALIFDADIASLGRGLDLRLGLCEGSSWNSTLAGTQPDMDISRMEGPDGR